MMRKGSLFFILLAIILFGGVFYFSNVRAQTGSITATITIRGCGNGVIESGEQCDNGGSNGACSATCSASCTTNSCGTGQSPGGGGGGGGGGGSTPAGTTVVLQGLAQPKAELTILKDGQVATGGILADAGGNFKVSLTTLTAGTYTFGIWTEDIQGRRSITFSFTATITQGMTTTIGNIFIPPTIELDKTGVKKGEILNILGQSTPQSTITITINSPVEIIKNTSTTDDGNWNYPLNTSVLDDGVHYTKAKAVTDGGLESSYSKTVSFGVGEGVAPGKVKKANINGDNKVNLIDFSILLYNWGTPKNKAADFNDDGWVNLTDFSIMMYQWTG